MEIAGERRINRERAAFSAAVAEVIRSSAPGESFGPQEYAAVQRNLESVLDAFYGRYPGDEAARFYRVIVENARQARLAALAEDARETGRLVRKHAAMLRRAAGD